MFLKGYGRNKIHQRNFYLRTKFPSIGSNPSSCTDNESVLEKDIGSGITLNDANLVSNSDGITFSSLTATKNEDGNPGAGLGGVTAIRQTLKNYERNWISDKEGMIQTAYGWTVDSAYDWRLQSNEMESGYSAAVFWGSLRMLIEWK